MHSCLTGRGSAPTEHTSVPPHITVEIVRGFALAASEAVLEGEVGKMVELARSNLRNIPRP